MLAPREQNRILALLILTTSVCVASTDLYTPSLPHLASLFGSTDAMVKLTMSLNLLGFATGQLVLGPLSDRFGRRPVMLTAMAGYCLFSLGCTLAPSIETLILCRLIQGFFAAVEASVGLAVIYDSFDHKGRIRALAVFAIAFAMTPAIAPILGGYVHVHFGWRANFALVTLLGAITFIALWRALPETSGPQPGALALARLRRTAGELLGNPAFLGPAIIASACTASIFVWITAAPFLIIDVFDVATQHFGFYHFAVVVAYVLGSLAARQTLRRFSPEHVLAAGIITSLTGLAGMLMLGAGGMLSAFSMTASACVMFFGMGPVYAIAPAQAMQVAGDGPGLGSALLHTLQMTLAGLASAAVGLRFGAESTPMLTVLLAVVTLSGAAVLSLRRSGSAR